MAILNIQTFPPTGQATVTASNQTTQLALPNVIQILTNDTYATVTGTGYLTASQKLGNTFNNQQMALVYTTDEGPVWTKVVITYSGSSVLNTVVSLVQISSPGDVTLPTIASNIIVSTDTAGTLANTTGTAINRGSIQAGLSGDAGTLISYPGTAANGSLIVAAVNAGGAFNTTISNGTTGQSQVISIPDSGATTANFIISKFATTQNITVGALQVNAGAITSGISTGGFVGLVKAFPTTATTGFIAMQAAINGSGDFGTTISNSVAQGQATVVTIPNAGAATANFLLDTGTGATATITKISTGATPVPMVDPGSCTITAAAGASNVSTVTIQLKDGAGTNIARSVLFRVYSSSAADGLTLQSAASTGYSVASGGLSLANGTAVTTQISAMSSATGGCVLSLTDTGKQTSYLVLVLPEGNKISAQLSAGSYGA